MTVNDMQADYVVIGAGSAGCVLANRLSQDGSRVVLLEAGPRDWHPMIHVPAGVLKLLYNPLVNWNYSTDPEAGIGGRQIHWPRGRVLGGSSSINGMLWIRGNPADYERSPSSASGAEHSAASPNSNTPFMTTLPSTTPTPRPSCGPRPQIRSWPRNAEPSTLLTPSKLGTKRETRNTTRACTQFFLDTELEQ